METAEASDAMRERLMRLSFELPSDMLNEALDLIFKADMANDGRFTAEQFNRLAVIAATTAGRKEGNDQETLQSSGRGSERHPPR